MHVEPNGFENASPARCITSEIHIGWNWLWFAPLGLFLLFFVETHTIPLAIFSIRLLIRRWDWGALLSPSAALFLSAVIGSVTYPVYCLILALTSLGNRYEKKKRYLHAVIALAILAALPLITDTLIWGSFPFVFDAAGVGHLRLLPFFPWPNGGYMTF